MSNTSVIPHLFRTEYCKMCAVLYRSFGIEHFEIVEDLVSDAFLKASEVWKTKGVPENPVAWLYTVARNNARDHFRKSNLFKSTINDDLRRNNYEGEDFELDLSEKNIHDSQLAMIFVACHPCNTPETQIALALNLLCGFGANEIASAFLTNREVIYKRLQRGKTNLKNAQIEIKQPTLSEIEDRLPAVFLTLYLLYNEGYYSAAQDKSLRKDLCIEAMRLCLLLVENNLTNTSQTNALLSLMCFQSSRFDARVNENGEVILYDDQDDSLWDKELIGRGIFYLKQASGGPDFSKYYLEAAIACWHTIKEDSDQKWENILTLYNKLLIVEYSPMAALNRTYALAKARGNTIAIVEAEKLDLKNHHLYHMLLGKLYEDSNQDLALKHYYQALELTKSSADQKQILKNIQRLKVI